MATRPVYSEVLWIGNDPSGVGTTYGPVVPSGFTWVVRDIIVSNAATTGLLTGVSRWQLVVGQVVVFTTPPDFSLVGMTYTAEDVRIVMNTDEQLQAWSLGPEWSWRVMGYALTLQ